MRKLILILFMFPLMIRAQITVSPLGTSPGIDPTLGEVRTRLWYDESINSIAFIHRSNSMAGWPTNGFILYDISTDGGLTWTVDHPIAGDSSNAYRLRFPQGFIFNPPGNTDPADASVTAFGPATDGDTGLCSTGWIGHYSGTGGIGNAAYAWTEYTCDSFQLPYIVPGGGHIVKNTGESYFVSALVNNDYSYRDTLVISKGIYNIVSGEVDYSFTTFPAPVCTDPAGNKMFAKAQTAWSDDGQTGYIVMLGNDWFCTFSGDSSWSFIVYKTTNGGLTWSHLTAPWLHCADWVLLNSNLFCRAGYDFDVVVDQNNMLHIATGIFPDLGMNSFGTWHQSWGLFDLYSSNGYDWSFQLLAKPQRYFTAISSLSGNSFQVSRNWDGSKISFTWFDTDSLTYSTIWNDFPDMHSIGWDLNQNMWTAEVNFTGSSSTLAEGACLASAVSYYSIDNGTDNCIPVAFALPTPLGTEHHYIGGACLNNYNLSNTPLSGFCVIEHVQPVSSDSGLELEIHPNPASSFAKIHINMSGEDFADIEISNTLGQVYMRETTGRFSGNEYSTAVNISGFPKGLYLCKVSGKERVCLKRFLVQ